MHSRARREELTRLHQRRTLRPYDHNETTNNRCSSLGLTNRNATDNFFCVFASSIGTSNSRAIEPFFWKFRVVPPSLSLGSSTSTSLSLSSPQLGKSSTIALGASFLEPLRRKI